MKVLLASSNPHKSQEISTIWDEMACQCPKRVKKWGLAPTRTALSARIYALWRCLSPFFHNPPGLRIELVGLDVLGDNIDEPVEDQTTFEGNAALKARYYAEASGMLCLADDSGLEVNALGDRPGVHSARYAGVSGDREVVSRANNQLLIKELGHTAPEKRTARFVCAMALAGYFTDAAHTGGASSPQAPANTGHSPGRARDTAAQVPIVALVRGTMEGRILTAEEAGPDARGRGTNGFGYDPLFLVPELGKTTAELSQQQKNQISHRGDAARMMWHEIQRTAKGRQSSRGKR